ncbi:MAG: hypothetical protein Q4A42_05020 [Tissierellia bacterium]|nr:hypothetical protein [Tissierellia bacterium]
MKKQVKTNKFLYKLIELIKAISFRLSLRKNKIRPKKDYYRDFYEPESQQYQKMHEYPNIYVERLAYSDNVHMIARPKYRAYEESRKISYRIAKKARNEEVKKLFKELFV